MESDLHPLSALNALVKYADDTNLLVPEKSHLYSLIKIINLLDYPSFQLGKILFITVNNLTS